MFEIKQFCALLSKAIENDPDRRYIIVADSGTAFFTAVACIPTAISGTAELVLPGSQAPMGYTLPACIGLGRTLLDEPDVVIVGLTGDGSFMSSVQELGGLHGLNVKLFVYENGGYVTIRNTCKRYFEGKNEGTGENGDPRFPDWRVLNCAFGPFDFCHCDESLGIDELESMLREMGPVLTIVHTDPNEVL